MRKLLLASKGSFITDGKYPDQRIFGKSRHQVRWAFITTASKSVPSAVYLEMHRQRMKELNWEVEEVDLDGKTPEQLRQIFKNRDAINMLGGNAFYLIFKTAEVLLILLIKHMI